MSNRSLLRILPLLTLASPLAVNARDAASIKPIALGQKYQGMLAPSPDNPNGEVCYGLSIEPNTRITLDIKTTGVGIVKFAVYDKTKGLRFFHNDVSSKQLPGTEATPTESRFSFPIVSDVSQLCLTTTNTVQGQQYNFTASGKRIRKSRSPVTLRPVAAQHLTAPAPKIQAQPPTAQAQAPKPEALPTASTPPAPPKPKPTKAPAVEIPPAPVGEPYCYVGTWQIADLNAYWLPSVQAFTQARVTEPQMLGYAKVTLEKNGNAWFEAVDLEQRYTLRAKDTGARIERIGLGVSGVRWRDFRPIPMVR